MCALVTGVQTWDLPICRAPAAAAAAGRTPSDTGCGDWRKWHAPVARDSAGAAAGREADTRCISTYDAMFEQIRSRRDRHAPDRHRLPADRAAVADARRLRTDGDRPRAPGAGACRGIGTREIGRASVRESGGTYVAISVGA